MEANIVVKAEDLTTNFADGIRKIFSTSAILHIKVEYDINQKPSSGKFSGPKTKRGETDAPVQKRAYKKRQPIVEGRKKPGPKPKSGSKFEEPRQKRAYKRRQPIGEGSKKRGPNSK